MIALIVGRKPISKSAYNGFRKIVTEEFSEVWVVDLGGDVIENPKLSGTKHNVFGIKIGVAIVILVESRIVKVVRYATFDRPTWNCK